MFWPILVQPPNHCVAMKTVRAHTKDSKGDAVCCCSRARRSSATKECEQEGAKKLQDRTVYVTAPFRQKACGGAQSAVQAGKIPCCHVDAKHAIHERPHLSCYGSIETLRGCRVGLKETWHGCDVRMCVPQGARTVRRPLMVQGVIKITRLPLTSSRQAVSSCADCHAGHVFSPGDSVSSKLGGTA